MKSQLVPIEQKI